MKKYSILPLLLIATLLIVSCAGTKKSAPIESHIVSPPTEAQVEVISEPATEPEVISAAPSFDLSEGEIEERFSYVYGFLLATNIVDQELDVLGTPFIAGSNDFFNYNDPLLDVHEIDSLFNRYQQFIDGEITLSQLEEEPGEPVGDLTTFIEKFSYGYGYVVQYNLQIQGIIVELTSFNAGINDCFAQIPLSYSDQEIDEIFNSYDSLLRSRYEQLFDDYAQTNLEEAQRFLDENSLNEGVITTESGLQYLVVEEGDGSTPTDGDVVEVDYLMTFLDGTIGDSSYSRGEPALFDMDHLIAGFSEGLKLMSEGSHYRFYVHPDLAYGRDGTEGVPPNALLLFDVELHNVVK